MSVRDRLRIIEETLLSDDWARLTKYKIAWKRRDGGESVGFRQAYDRGNGAVILPYDPARRTVLLTRQFRLPALLNGYDELLIEAAAGLLDEARPEDRIREEAEEELGLRLSNVTQVFDMFMSPGSVTERLFFFIATYTEADRISAGGGLAEEGEDIEVLEMTIGEAMAQVADGRIRDAKTVILLQHAALHLFAD
ncbi:GDP-mannose pyrophosphatase [Actibacterium mucosum KCTC 23349]|uniref:GDP-mannose pyrophosphatase n=1 Tax=Actibacterium mucosum KCTC 23349 TaxID=1454373 RepID=A0A037ZED5_9RHOB|nr:NUDIX domain-containing protein [Actibacterium mucosum]KAJ54845.1 GDP-mannose pyrophosphatase [Actibacterium mucosum KCTC 23349]